MSTSPIEHPPETSDLREDRSGRLRFWQARSLPNVLQSETAECGLACIAMIAGYHGHHTDLPALRRRFSLSLKGMTARRLIEVAHVLGLQCRPLRLDMEELGQLPTPCVLHWDLDHFVVLRSVGKHKAVVHDPAVGVRSLSLVEIGRHFTGVAIEFSKGPSFQRQRETPPISLRALAGSVRGLGRGLTQIFGLALVLEIFALLAPLFMQLVVDQVIADGDHDLLTFLGLSFALLIVLETLVSALRSWTVMWLSTHFNLGWTGNVFQHLMRLPQSYFGARHLGDIVSRFGAIDTIQQTLTTRFVEILLDGLLASITLVVLFASTAHCCRSSCSVRWRSTRRCECCTSVSTARPTSVRSPSPPGSTADFWKRYAACRRSASTIRKRSRPRAISTQQRTRSTPRSPYSAWTCCSPRCRTWRPARSVWACCGLARGWG
ncbi:hypothetical protein XALC_1904 [Xanthomonas albilineans GPE PC73]|uniref:Uncharacterized protein n=1 Tax=Xanthomonas albilineans (strain GPE PC73 / CFBP 7063) TaxID=380358 RepID=D2UGZ8_XANAP|nr:hypothetical protein XaFJ1_GM001890 [Xanthomonas albilineans]CBE70795.1 hypothetical protein XALC_1904 [Xanthomonas albilineans GPE PC73]